MTPLDEARAHLVRALERLLDPEPERVADAMLACTLAVAELQRAAPGPAALTILRERFAKAGISLDPTASQEA
jgi:hypothetical protein